MISNASVVKHEHVNSNTQTDLRQNANFQQEQHSACILNTYVINTFECYISWKKNHKQTDWFELDSFVHVKRNRFLCEILYRFLLFHLNAELLCYADGWFDIAVIHIQNRSLALQSGLTLFSLSNGRLIFDTLWKFTNNKVITWIGLKTKPKTECVGYMYNCPNGIVDLKSMKSCLTILKW